MKLLTLAMTKLRAMAGGITGIVITFALSLLMLITAAYALNAKGPGSLVIAVADENNTELSAEFREMLRNDETASIKLVDAETVEKANSIVRDGGAEGVLLIEEDFSDVLEKGGTGLSFFPAQGSSSAEAAEEIIIGNAISLRSKLRARSYAEQLLGRELTAEELSKLDELSEKAINKEGKAVDSVAVGKGIIAGSSVFGAFYARFAGFTAFLIMLCLLMLGAFTGSSDARASSQRMLSLGKGVRPELGANLLALGIFGAVLLAFSYIAGGLPKLPELGAGLAYVFCTASLSILLGSFAGSERAEIASPFIALITSLAGGCFINPEALGGALKTVSLFTPQGLFLSAVNGRLFNIPILLIAGAVMLMLVALRTGARPFKK
ncbi:MAG: ABC transporter permease [Clostridia bacterium]|nr:ABC transporter permease [Clostridia bacterium]